MKRFLFLGTALIAVLPFAQPMAARAQTTPPPVPSTPTTTATGNADQSASNVPPLTEPEVVVTATRIPEPADDSASSVTVVTRQQIDENQYQNVAQALEQVPGVEVETSGTPGQLDTLIIRGATTNENLILVDGKRLPADLAGGFDLTDMTLDNVERIEVVRGPLSGVQGGSAMGGVINIITQDGKGLEKPEYSVSLEAGSYSTIHDVVTARGAQGAFDWSVAVSSLDTQNQRANNDYDLQNYTGNMGWQISKELRFTLATTHRVSTAQNPAQTVNSSGYINDPSSWSQIELWTVIPELEWKTTDWWTQTLSYERSQYRIAAHTSLESLMDDEGDTQRTQIDENRFDYDNIFKVTDQLTLTAGSEFSDEKTWQADDGDPFTDIFGDPPVAASNYNNNQTNTSGYLGADWQPVKGWKIDPSFRTDHYSDFGTFANWRFATSYRVAGPQTLFHSSYGTATTPPSEQNYLSFGGFQVPNFNLKPEQSKGFDFGVEQPLWNGKVTLGSTYFQNNISDLIVDNQATSQPYNVNQARTQGVENTATWHPLDQLDIGLGYTYTDAEDLSNHRLLSLRPRNVYTFSVTERPIPGVSVAWSGSALNGVEETDPTSASFAYIHEPGYFTSRVAVTWQARKYLQVFGRIENVFNDKYEEVAGYPALDQGFYGGVKFTF